MAVKWLKSQAISFQEVPIRTSPPPVAELEKTLAAYGNVKPLLNTSGQDYRVLGLKDRLPQMSEKAVLELLSGNGNLIKRPLLVDEQRKLYLTGFKGEEWAAKLGA